MTLRVDQRLAGRLLEQQLQLTVVYADNGKQALEVIRRQTPDIVITDMLMPEMDGLELVEAIRLDYPALPVIVMTAVGSEELAADALKKVRQVTFPNDGWPMIWPRWSNGSLHWRLPNGGIRKHCSASIA